MQHLRALGSHKIHLRESFQDRVIKLNMNFPRNTFLELAKEANKSDAFIEKTLNYADKLLQQGLPVIFSLNHFAQILGIDRIEISTIIENRGFHYSYYVIKKKSGGYRRIITPHKNIRYLQDWIKINILDKINVHHACTGFVKNKSILDNAKPHINAEAILNIDLKNFFETINEKRVYGIFRHLGYHTNLAVEFARICTVSMPEGKFEKLEDNLREHFEDYYYMPEAVLVQGAPTSPTLSNIACLCLDNRLLKLANKLGVNYSRYADDITFSGTWESLPSFNLLKKIIEDEDFIINWNKKGIYKRGQRQLVTGLLINDKARIPKKYKKDIFRHLFFCEKYGPTAHFNRISPNKSYSKEWLMGKILYVNSIEPDVAKSMYKKYNMINWGS